LLRVFLTTGVAVCLAVAAAAAPITPTPDEEAARDALGDRLPDAKLLWVSAGKIYYSPVKDFAPQLVTEGAIPEGNPRWSPDGTKILYVKDPKGVWIMNADFSNRQEVIPDGDTASWTRDGLSITAVNANDRRQIIKYDLAGGSLSTIYDSSDSDYSGETYAGSEHSQGAELHAGGRYLLTFTLDQNHNTFIVDLQDKRHLYNSDMDRGDCSPAWAPDGTYTTTTARTGDRPVLKTAFDASGPNLASSSDHFVGIGTVCNCAYYVHGHRVSNDGQWVAMGGLNRDENNREIYIWKIGEPESAVVRMTFETAEDQSPSLYVGSVSVEDGSDGEAPDGTAQDADAGGGDDAGAGGDDGSMAGDDAGTTGDDASTAGDDAGVAGDDAGVKPDAGADADAGGDPIVKGDCNCGTSTPPDLIMLLVALSTLWRRKIRHAH